MLETLAVVTFLLTNGTRSVLPVYPPGGEYHRHFGWICEQNKQNATEQVHKLLSEKKITPPDGVEQILSIKIFCVATTKA